MLKKGLLTGMLLFGIFFGAGNLIFPPSLGLNSGSNFLPAYLGFIISGVGIAIITLIVGTLTPKGYQEEMNKKFSPWFSLIFLILLYLTIGPFFAIPRTATTAFAIGVEPLINNSSVGLIIFTIIYFLCAYFISLNPTKILNSVGKLLTPAFALLIIILVVFGIFKYSVNPPQVSAEGYNTTIQAFGSGFIEGYNTLDALAALVFCIISMNTLKQLGFSSKKEYLYSSWAAGIATAIGFGVLYLGLSYLGNHFPVSAEVIANAKINKGAYILSEASKGIFGSFGQIFLGIMVVLTCFTTTVGLIVATSNFFSETFKQFSYKTYVTIFTIIGLLISNLGLNSVIKYSVPVLLLLYPITITIVIIVVVNKFVHLSKIGLSLTMTVVTIISLLSVVASSFNISDLTNILSRLPLFKESLAWLVPCIIGIIISLFLPNKIKGDSFDFEEFNK